MHEIGLVDDIISTIKGKLKEGSSVKRVNILIGELEHVTPDHFEFHFREHAKGTSLENAELKFKRVKARFRCKDCESEFSAEEGMDGCPGCKSKVSDIIAGTGVHVASLELT